MKKNLYYIIYIGVLMMFLAGCQDEGLFTPTDDGPVSVSYRVEVEDGLQSRAIGDAAQVNSLAVVVFKSTGEYVLRKDLSWPLTEEGLDLTLLRGSYRVLFWLQHENTYAIADDGTVSVSYGDWTGTVADMEKWDAFYGVDNELTIDSEARVKPITLTRPLGQLNWAANNLPENGEEEYKATVTLTGVATSFHPFGQEEAVESSAAPVTFTFSGLSDETLTWEDNQYSLLSGIYLFPATLSATFTLTQGEETLQQKEGVETTVSTNIRANVLTTIEPEVEEKPEQEPGEDEPAGNEPEGDENKKEPEGGEGTTPENGGGEGTATGNGEEGTGTGGEGTTTTTGGEQENN